MHLTCFCKVDGVFVVLFRGVGTGRKVEFPVSEIVKDRAKSQVPFLYVQGIWLYPLPDLWRIGHIF